MRDRITGLVLSLSVLACAPLSGQVWDTPAFHPPYGEDGGTLYLFFPNEVSDVGAAGTWRKSGEVLDLGLRGGVSASGEEVAVLAGLDVKNELVAATPRFPLDVAWVGGVGVSGVPETETVLVRLPLGFTVGRRFSNPDPEGGSGPELSLTPYVYPRVALDFTFRRGTTGPALDALGGAGAGDETDLRFDVDLGFDARFAAEWRLRVAVTLGHDEAVGLGFGFRAF